MTDAGEIDYAAIEHLTDAGLQVRKSRREAKRRRRQRLATPGGSHASDA